MNHGPKTIGFFTDGRAFDGSSANERILSRDQSALIRAAQALSNRGHRITVFNNCPRSSRYGGVTYRPKADYTALAKKPGFDVFIVSHYYQFFTVPIWARLKIFWSHGPLIRPLELKPLQDRIDLVFTQSDYHRDHYRGRLPELEGRILPVGTGLDLKAIDRALAETAKQPNKIMYISRPEGGLKSLLELIWPLMLEKRPDLKLFICDFGLPEDKAPEEAESASRLYRLAERSENVTLLRNLNNREYYRHLAQAACVLYPCDYPEMGCPEGLEAQASLTPFVTTEAFCLKETIEIPEFIVSGSPGQADFPRRFAHQALRLLENPALAAGLTRQARAAVETNYTWEAVSAKWDRIFDLNLRTGSDKKQKKFKSELPGLLYSRLKKEKLKILILHSKYLLVKELLNSIKSLGHETRLIMFRDQELEASAITRRLLTVLEDFKPDFVLTVNHLGFDAEGVVARLLNQIRMPVASWFVDSPLLNLYLIEKNRFDYCSIFLWDLDYKEDLKALGLDRIHYLPLGTDEQQFKPLNGHLNRFSELNCQIGFVGNSMKDLISNKTAHFKFEPDLPPLLDEVAFEFSRVGDRRPIRLMEDMGLMRCPSVTELSAADKIDLEALIIWRATQIYRLEMIQSLKPLKPTIIGDRAWENILNPDFFLLKNPLNYYKELPYFYPICKINFNATSMQMKTGLNQRVFDVPACGAFVLSDYRAQMEDLFELGKEAVCYHEGDEALDLARYYLIHGSARRAIADRAFKRVLAEHTYRHRLTKLIEQMRRDF